MEVELNGEIIIHDSGAHPRAEVRDSETGEVIFPAIKGPLMLIVGGKTDEKDPTS